MPADFIKTLSSTPIHRACLLAFLLAACIQPSSMGAAAEEPAKILEHFSRQWPPERLPYRTAEDTETWKAYTLALRNLVAQGPKAVPGLRKGCADANYQVRALCARALGFLGAREAEPELIKLLDDPRSEVSVIAADALGQLQSPEAIAALEAGSGKKRKKDVTLHIKKALERKVPIEKDAVTQLLQLNAQNISSAQIGKPAPDFTLKDPKGKSWSLSQFKGKKAVVLIFIYGDG